MHRTVVRYLLQTDPVLIASRGSNYSLVIVVLIIIFPYLLVLRLPPPIPCSRIVYTDN